MKLTKKELNMIMSLFIQKMALSKKFEEIYYPLFEKLSDIERRL